jgi:hypothetical protein
MEEEWGGIVQIKAEKEKFKDLNEVKVTDTRGK